MTDDPNVKSERLEILSVWAQEDGEMVFAARLNVTDPGAWGIVLARAARFIAMGIRDKRGEDVYATIATIREMFERELNEPTSEITGQLFETNPPKAGS